MRKHGVNVYEQIASSKRGTFFLLIDPDKTHNHPLLSDIGKRILSKVDIVLVGGSSLLDNQTDDIYKTIRSFARDIPIVSFLGSANQLSAFADAILFTSLISGRNPRYLIEEQVAGARFIYENNIPTIPTAYILIDSGEKRAVNTISSTEPLPQAGIDNIINHALAGKFMGMDLIYFEAGSGAGNTVSVDIIKSARNKLDIPIIVGGGIKCPQIAQDFIKNGASGVVVGNFAEDGRNIKTLERIIDAVQSSIRI